MDERMDQKENERQKQRESWAALKLYLSVNREFPRWNEDDLLSEQSRYRVLLLSSGIGDRNGDR